MLILNHSICAQVLQLSIILYCEIKFSFSCFAVKINLSKHNIILDTYHEMQCIRLLMFAKIQVSHIAIKMNCVGIPLVVLISVQPVISAKRTQHMFFNI